MVPAFQVSIKLLYNSSLLLWTEFGQRFSCFQAQCIRCSGISVISGIFLKALKYYQAIAGLFEALSKVLI